MCDRATLHIWNSKRFIAGLLRRVVILLHPQVLAVVGANVHSIGKIPTAGGSSERAPKGTLLVQSGICCFVTSHFRQGQ